MTALVGVTLGMPVLLQGVFVDQTGNPVDPTSVTVTVRNASGVVAQLQAAKIIVGTWGAQFIPPAVGVYEYRVQAFGAVVAAEESGFSVTSAFSP